jgi:hypothetical protein
VLCSPPEHLCRDLKEAPICWKIGVGELWPWSIPVLPKRSGASHWLWSQFGHALATCQAAGWREGAQSALFSRAAT